MILRAEYAAWRAVLHVPEDRDGVVVELAWLISGRQPRTAVAIALAEPPADFLSWIELYRVSIEPWILGSGNSYRYEPDLDEFEMIVRPIRRAVEVDPAASSARVLRVGLNGDASEHFSTWIADLVVAVICDENARRSEESFRSLLGTLGQAWESDLAARRARDGLV